MTVLGPQARAIQSDDRVRPKAHRLLCIDDNADITRAIAARLQRYGVEVLSALSGREGLRLAVMIRPAVVITDIAMPDGSGEFVIRQMKSHSRTADIPVIVMSGVHDYQLASRMQACGAAAFLRKPVPFDELLFEMTRFIDLPSQAGNFLCDSPSGSEGELPCPANRPASEAPSSGGRFWRVDPVMFPMTSLPAPHSR